MVPAEFVTFMQTDVVTFMRTDTFWYMIPFIIFFGSWGFAYLMYKYPMNGEKGCLSIEEES